MKLQWINTKHPNGEEEPRPVAKKKKKKSSVVEQGFAMLLQDLQNAEKTWFANPLLLSGLLSFFGVLLFEVFLLVLPPLLDVFLFLVFSLGPQRIIFIICWANYFATMFGCIGWLDLHCCVCRPPTSMLFG